MAARDPDDAELALSLALLQIRLQKFDAAQNLLHHLRTVQPDSIPVAAALTELQIRQTDYDAALRICDEMVQKHANTAAYILRGQTFVAAGQIERAQKDFDQAVVLEPDNPRTWLAASEFNRITDRIEQAISAMDKALALDPDNFDMQKRMIALLLSSTQPNRVQRAEQLLETTRSAAPSDTELQLYQIRCLLLKNDPPAIENAQQMLLTVTEEHPKMIVAWVLLSDIYLNQGMVGKAMETVLQGLAYGPTSTPLLLVKARIEASQSPATALSTLTLLHEREPDNSDIVLELAKTYTAAQQYEDSIRLTETYLEQNADTANDNIRLQHAIALSRNGQPQQSQQVFDALYQTSPDTSMVLFAETDLLIANRQWNALEARLTPRFEGLGHHADADVIIRKLLENAEAPSLALAEKLITGMLKHNPDSPEANKAMALLLQIKGATAKSAELYSRVLENNPDDLIAINNLAWILCEQQGDYQKALKLAEHGLRKTPDYPDLIDTRGMIYYRMSEYQKALRDFSRCAEMYPDNSAAMGVTHFHLARAFAALEQPDRAIENLKQCLDFNQKYGGLSGSESEEAQGLLDTLSQKGKRATYAY
jgi:tetratricopeptide (TPR) repeat protein